MKRHTDGPWKVDILPYATPISCDKMDKNGHRLYVAHAILDSRDMPMEEQKANARLIAAAPDMYEALVAINKILLAMRFMDKVGLEAAHDQILAALARVHGK